ncbi:hypothetical protein PR202_ga18175 [Eleusine coracana subsp. coracana]|uniref:Secreted protein n=1 Tax=Eleusine coracana subsp. coracana TaxID=191504 RepID=A0AAV5CS22_ELECO|nr:hypothetical protein PR202_ga18175 [Eleusine coracana subsp. coracana]
MVGSVAGSHHVFILFYVLAVAAAVGRGGAERHLLRGVLGEAHRGGRREEPRRVRQRPHRRHEQVQQGGAKVRRSACN